MEGEIEPNVTAAVAEFASKKKWEDLPNAVIEKAKVHIIDTFGVILAGCVEKCAQITQDVLVVPDGKSSIYGTKLRSLPYLAALANGIAGHALDYDDTQLSTSEEAVYGLLTHPSNPVLAAAAATAEDLGATGKQLICAYVVGVEVACRIADAINPRHYRDGFHSTGTIGTLGAAAAAGNLLELDSEKMATALGIAASMASGLRENFGTMTKPFHAGRAASNGVAAAYLAQAGFTASTKILEAQRGFFRAAGGGFDPDKILGKIGAPYFLVEPGVSIKPYPSGSLSHPAQDLILEIVLTNDLKPDDIEKIEVGTNSNVLNALIHKRPKTGLEGKFSMEYCMAAGVVYRKAGLAEFTDQAVNNPEVQEIIRRVHVYVDPELEQIGYKHVRTRVKVYTTRYGVFSGEAEWAKGHPLKPLKRDELEGKFLECAAKAIDATQAAKALEQLWKLEAVHNLSKMLSNLVPA